jgi:hypothetical protein
MQTQAEAGWFKWNDAMNDANGDIFVASSPFTTHTQTRSHKVLHFIVHNYVEQ